MTESEIKTRSIRLNRELFENFPKDSFEIAIGGVTLTKKIDKYNRMFLNVKNCAKAGDMAEFYKKPDGSFEVSFRQTTN